MDEVTTATEVSHWIIPVVTAIVAFLFGQTGIFQKTLDFVLKSKEERHQEESDKIAIKEKQIKELSDEVDKLKDTISKLDRDLVLATTYVKTLLAYLEAYAPNDNLFVVKLAEEIRKNTEDIKKLKQEINE